jgi:predicted metal-dependent hydrolase
MAYKQFALDERTSVTIYKRKSSRSLRLSVAADGSIKVSIPAWAPYKAGLKFAESKRAWIAAQRRPDRQLHQGQTIGKAHRLRFEPVAAASKVTSRIKQNEITISYPASQNISDPEVQRVANAAGIRALRRQAETLLPRRLADLASKHNFSHRKVTIKQMKSRWGSCDSHSNIVLNLFLMQLPWDCIDYVLLHELTHTKVMKHGPVFWQAMAEVLPNVAEMRKRMRGHHPILHSSAQVVA